MVVLESTKGHMKSHSMRVTEEVMEKLTPWGRSEQGGGISELSEFDR